MIEWRCPTGPSDPLTRSGSTLTQMTASGPSRLSSIDDFNSKLYSTCNAAGENCRHTMQKMLGQMTSLHLRQIHEVVSLK